MPLREFEETRGWSSSDSDGSDMEDGESEEAAVIRSRFQPPSEGEDNPTSKSEVINEEPYDMDLTNIEIKQRIVYRSHGLDKQLKVAGKQWSQLLTRFSHWETKQHGHWVWRELIDKPIRGHLRRMRSGANLYFGSGHALDNVTTNYKHPCQTKHPSYHEGVVDKLLKRASKIIRYGQRVVPKVAPEEDIELKRLRSCTVRNEARRRERSFQQSAVQREQDRVEYAEEEELADREA